MIEVIEYNKLKAFMKNKCKNLPRAEAVAEMIIYIGKELEEQLARKPTFDEIMAEIDEVTAERERRINLIAM